MNKTYKVARSLTRGTVVTSEVASSRQGKALKMVVAALAAAFVGGAAMAADADEWKDKVLTEDVEISTTVNATGTTDFGGHTLTIKNGGTFRSAFSATDVKLVGSTLNLEEGGVVNMTKANSECGVLLAGATFNLNGGKLQVAGQDYTGNFKVGTSSAAGNLNINTDYTVGDLLIRNGTVTIDGIEEAGATLTVTGKLTFSDKAGTHSLVLKDGSSLKTAGSNVFEKKEVDGQITYDVLDGWKNVTVAKDKVATLELTDTGYSYTVTQLSKAQQALSQGKTGAIQLVLKGTLKSEEGEKLTADVVQGLRLANTVATAEDGVFNLVYRESLVSEPKFLNSKTDTVLSGIDFKNYESSDNSICIDTGWIYDTDPVLVLTGNDGGDIFKNLAPTTQSADVEGKLVLGDSAASAGNVNVDTLRVESLDVVGNFEAKNIYVGSAWVSGELAVDQIAAGGWVTVDGTLTASRIAVIDGPEVEVKEGGQLIIGKQLTGVKALDSERIPQIGSTQTDEDSGPLEQIAGVVTVNKGAVASTNANGRVLVADIFGASENDLTDVALLYVDSKLALSNSGEFPGELNVGIEAEDEAGEIGTVWVGENGALVVDMSSFASGSTVFEGSGLKVKGKNNFILTNLMSEKSVTLLSKTSDAGVEIQALACDSDSGSGIDVAEGALTTTHALLKGETKENKLNVVFNEAGASDVEEKTKAVLKAALAEGANIKTQVVIAAVADTTKDAGFVTEYDDGKYKLTDQGEWALEEYFAAPVVAGIYNVAYDATAQVNATVARRNVENTTGSGVWADVFYTANKAKKAYGDQGYSADIYGGMLGVDTVFANGFKVGGAVTVGTSDADSERSFSKFSTDTDFYGVSLYAGTHMGDTFMYLSADASYLWADNDLKGSVAGVSASESLDSKVFTAGVRADLNVYESKALTVAPHAGVRYTSIDVDDYRGLKSDSMNIVEIPIGIKVAGNFEASGFKLTPAFDFTVVPEVGDKKVSTVIGDVDVINNVYNASLGVQAEMGNFSFGVNYKCGFGRDDRSNNSFNANVRYTF